jgi:hypothetical protein
LKRFSGAASETVRDQDRCLFPEDILVTPGSDRGTGTLTDPARISLFRESALLDADPCKAAIFLLYNPDTVVGKRQQNADKSGA